MNRKKESDINNNNAGRTACVKGQEVVDLYIRGGKRLPSTRRTLSKRLL